MIECETVHFDEICQLKNIKVHYGFQKSPFGTCLLGYIEDKSNQKIVCHLSFNNNKDESLSSLQTRFSGEKFIEDCVETRKLTDIIFNKNNLKHPLKIKILLKGTDFQIKVWKSLLKIPFGEVTTYGEIARSIENPKAVRAVGSALKANEIVYLIPCHRVICKDGSNKFSLNVSIKISMQNYESQMVKNGKVVNFSP